MRYAPKWRGWLPTSRQIRFAIQSRVAAAVPGVAARFDYYPRSSTGADLEPYLIDRWEASSSAAITEQERVFLEMQAQLEIDHAKKIHRSGHAVVSTYLLPNCHVLGSTGAVVMRDEKMMVGDPTRNSRRFSMLRERKVEGPCMLAVGTRAGYRHYYNWLVGDMTYRRPALDRIVSRFPQLTLLVRGNRPGFQRAAHDELCRRHAGLRIEEIDPGEKVACEALVYMRKVANTKFREPVNEGLAQGLCDFYRQIYGIAPVTPFRRVYVARNDAKIRRILNEDELVAPLRAAGFEVVCPGKLSHREQVRLFYEAAVVVGAHGAGLTNLLFMQPGGQVLELFPDDYVQSAYLWISKMRGLAYQPFVCEISRGHQNFRVPGAQIDAVMAALEARKAPEARNVPEVSVAG